MDGGVNLLLSHDGFSDMRDLFYKSDKSIICYVYTKHDLKEGNMRVAELLKSNSEKPVISFEFFRAKTEKEAQTLDNTLNILSGMEHDYVSVTFGAGGTTREGSFQLVDRLKNQMGLNTVAYIAGIGLGPDDVTGVLDKFVDMGVETVFVIRGDEPTGDDKYKPHPDAFRHASDLLAFIKGRYDFCLGAAGYPEGHLEAESPEKDLEYLKLKQDSGAEYIVAQYFYDNQFFYDFVEKCRKTGINIPVIPGIMPIYTAKMTQILSKVCGSTLTDKVVKGIESVPPDEKGGVARFGIDFATDQCRDLLANGVSGIHFYTMNRGKSVQAILQTLKEEGRL